MKIREFISRRVVPFISQIAWSTPLGTDVMPSPGAPGVPSEPVTYWPRDVGEEWDTTTLPE